MLVITNKTYIDYLYVNRALAWIPAVIASSYIELVLYCFYMQDLVLLDLIISDNSSQFIMNYLFQFQVFRSFFRRFVFLLIILINQIAELNILFKYRSILKHVCPLDIPSIRFCLKL